MVPSNPPDPARSREWLRKLVLDIQEQDMYSRPNSGIFPPAEVRVIETAFLNLCRGNRLSMYMGLKMDEGVPYRYAKDYTYVEVPLASVYNPSEEAIVTKATRNQRLQIIPACNVDVKAGYKILVKTNPKLQEFANCPSLTILDGEGKEQASFYASFHRDFDLSKLDWAVRLYLMV